jgi:hypothetical protein
VTTSRTQLAIQQAQDDVSDAQAELAPLAMMLKTGKRGGVFLVAYTHFNPYDYSAGYGSGREHHAGPRIVLARRKVRQAERKLNELLLNADLT